MDKQGAIIFIHRELDNNRSQEEIVTLLSQELGAPPDLVSKFVAQVVAERPKFTAAPRRQPASPAPAAQAVPPASVSYQPVEAAARSAHAQPDQQPSWAIPKLEFDQEEMDQLVLKFLSKSQRHNDVVAIVCERTGMNWGDAQRLVARVASKNRKHLAFRQNIIIIPLSLVAILAGLALLYAGVSEAYLMGSAAVADPSSLAYANRDVVWAIPTGLTLLVGGGFGLYKALKAQFE